MNLKYQNSQKGIVSTSLMSAIVVIGAVVIFVIIRTVLNYRSWPLSPFNKDDIVEDTVEVSVDSTSDTKNPDMSDKLIKSVKVENCEIIAIPRSGDQYKIGKLTSGGSEELSCIKYPKIAVAKSGEYVAVEDINGGIDLWLRVYSVKTGTFTTLGVWGTSSLLDMEFLYANMLVIATGYPSIPEEQWLKVYDIGALYKDYPKNVDERYDYFIFDNNSPFVKNLPIKAVEGDYFDIVVGEYDLTFYGGTESSQVERGKFPLNAL